jgi:capsular exopolysaccharide synthesis family protein
MMIFKKKEEIKDYSNSFVIRDDPRSPVSEAFRTLRTNLKFYGSEDHPIQSILISSAFPGEGKSILLTNLALTIAQNGEKVIICDCDLRRPVINKIFKENNRYGLTNVLVGDKDLSEIIKINNHLHPNLSYIPSGPIPPNPYELLGSKKMSEVIKELQNQADIVLFDSPPIIGFADGLLLANQVDGVLLVVEVKRVHREAVKQAKNQLEKSKAKILGVVLNKVDLKRDGYYYNYHYYNYQKYYK